MLFLAAAALAAAVVDDDEEEGEEEEDVHVDVVVSVSLFLSLLLFFVKTKFFFVYICTFPLLQITLSRVALFSLTEKLNCVHSVIRLEHVLQRRSRNGSRAIRKRASEKIPEDVETIGEGKARMTISRLSSFRQPFWMG